jgi:hypothetical protein
MVTDLAKRFGVEERHYSEVRKQTHNLTDSECTLSTGTLISDCIKLKIAAEELGYTVKEPDREFTDDRGYPLSYDLSKK